MNRRVFGLAIGILLATVLAIDSYKYLKGTLLYSDGQIIEWEQDIVRLGMQPPNRNFDIPFRMHNTSGKSITVVAEPCCGLEAAVLPSIVKPGATAVVHLIGQTPTTTDGEIKRHHLIVHVKSLPLYTKTLELLYSVEPTWHCVPAEIDFGSLVEGQTIEKRFQVFLERGAPPLGKPLTYNSQIQVRQVADKLGNYRTFAVRYSAPVGVHGPSKCEISVRTSDPQHQVITIPARALTLPCAQAIPTVVHLKEFIVGTFKNEVVRIVTSQPRVSISILHKPAWLKATVHRVCPTEIDIKATIRAQSSGAISDSLRVEVKTSHTFILEVPISGFATIAH